MKQLDLDYIRSKDMTFITGIGKNKHIANLIADGFKSLGYKVMFLDSTDLLHGSLGLLRSLDNISFVFLSKTGLTKEIRELTTIIHSQIPSCELWMLTCNPNIIFEEGNLVLIPFDREIDPHNLFPSNSLISFLEFFYEMLSGHFKSNNNFLSNHPGGGLHFWRKK